MSFKFKRFLIITLTALLVVLFFGGKGYRDSELRPTESLHEKIRPHCNSFQVAELRRQLSDCSKSSGLSLPNAPTIYAITPTYARPAQKAELTRFSHTLMHIPNLHWIVVEDSEKKTELVANLLAKTGIKYTHLYASTPPEWKAQPGNSRYSKPRGVLQRNAALDWIRQTLSPTSDGVIYFADDDNSYSLQLFDEIRSVKGVGVWPVGLSGGVMVERPEVNQEGKVVDWKVVWSPERPFPIDMAGFAINLKLFFTKSEYKFLLEVKTGYQESTFLQHFVNSLEELEAKADKCTKVLVWHTRTEDVRLQDEVVLKKLGIRSDAGIEV